MAAPPSLPPPPPKGSRPKSGHRLDVRDRAMIETHFEMVKARMAIGGGPIDGALAAMFNGFALGAILLLFLALTR